MDEIAEVKAPEAEKKPVFLAVAEALGARNLVIVIVTMPLVFAVVVIATLMIFGEPGDEATEPARVRSTAADTLEQPALAARPATPATAVATDPAPLVVPAGGAIGAMALDGDRLALRIDLPEGGEVVVYDLSRGAVLQRIPVREARGKDDL
jgi:hypothetical protein